MSPPGYQAAVVKTSWCRNERQKRYDSRKAGSREVGKKIRRAKGKIFCVGARF